MKKICSLLFTKMMFLICFIQPSVEAEKPSRFDKWLVSRTESLNSKGAVIQTSIGPIQYVWKGDRRKPVVMCLHGGFGGWDQSLLIGQNLLDEGFSVLAISRPGYLGSPTNLIGLISNVQQATAMKEVLDALKVNKASVIGFSAGGPVAFQMAKLFPERVSALVLESIGSHDSDILFYIFLASFLNYEQLTGDTPTLDFEAYLIYLANKTDFYSMAQKVLKMDNDLPPAQLSERITFVTRSRSQSKFLSDLNKSLTPLSLRLDGIKNDVLLAALGNWPQIPSFYQNVNTPAFIVQGAHDTNGNDAVATYVNSQLPHSRLLLVQGCGHFVWLGVNTSKWEKQVTAFLKENVR
jgi:pimeloyl-ACP methyl ester carboxylesterase